LIVGEEGRGAEEESEGEEGDEEGTIEGREVSRRDGAGGEGRSSRLRLLKSDREEYGEKEKEAEREREGKEGAEKQSTEFERPRLILFQRVGFFSSFFLGEEGGKKESRAEGRGVDKEDPNIKNEYLERQRVEE